MHRQAFKSKFQIAKIQREIAKYRTHSGKHGIHSQLFRFHRKTPFMTVATKELFSLGGSGRGYSNAESQLLRPEATSHPPALDALSLLCHLIFTLKISFHGPPANP